jgi:hypothetical protein
LRRISGVLDQARLAISKSLADRLAFLIAEFKLQATVPGPDDSLAFGQVK